MINICFKLLLNFEHNKTGYFINQSKSVSNLSKKISKFNKVTFFSHPCFEKTYVIENSDTLVRYSICNKNENFFREKKFKDYIFVRHEYVINGNNKELKNIFVFCHLTKKCVAVKGNVKEYLGTNQSYWEILNNLNLDVKDSITFLRLMR